MPQPEQKGGEAVRAVYSDSGAFLTHTSWQKKEILNQLFGVFTCSFQSLLAQAAPTKLYVPIG